jgi:hypothetical protein
MDCCEAAPASSAQGSPPVFVIVLPETVVFTWLTHVTLTFGATENSGRTVVGAFTLSDSQAPASAINVNPQSVLARPRRRGRCWDGSSPVESGGPW